MYVDHELVEFMPVDDQEYKEVIEEYEEEILMQEGAPEPAQGKPQCITPIFTNHWICIWCAFKLEVFYENHMHKYIYPWVLLV